MASRAKGSGLSLDKEQNSAEPEKNQPDQPSESIPQIDGEDGGDVIRVIMAGEDPMINARDKLTRHLGMTLGATMVATGIYTAYTWGSAWLWYFLILVWGALALHLLVFWTRRIKAGPPPPAYQISMEPEGEDPPPPEEPVVDQAEEPGAPPEQAPAPAGRIIEPPRHKITVIQPKDDG